MAISLKHTTQAAGTDAGNGEIRKAQWNEEHTLTMATARLIGRTTAATGAAEEIAVGSNLSLSALTLNLATTITGMTAITTTSLTTTNFTLGGTAVTANATELNVLDGIPATLTATELGYVDGVTSAIQTQLDGKQASDADLTALAALTTTGLVARTGAGVFSLRTITGTTNQIDVTNGGGVAGEPTLALSSTLAVPGAVTATADDDGAFSTGTYTPTPVGGNFKRITNTGAFTLAAPSAAGDYTLIVQITNDTGAGAITLSSFSKTAGDAFTTTVGHDFFVFISKVNGFTLATVQALQ